MKTIKFSKKMDSIFNNEKNEECMIFAKKYESFTQIILLNNEKQREVATFNIFNKEEDLPKVREFLKGFNLNLI